jgi:hypothetical protein
MRYLRIRPNHAKLATLIQGTVRDTRRNDNDIPTFDFQDNRIIRIIVVWHAESEFCVAAKDSQTFMRGRVVVGFAVHAVAPLMSNQRVRKTGEERRGEVTREMREGTGMGIGIDMGRTWGIHLFDRNLVSICAALEEGKMAG